MRAPLFRHRFFACITSQFSRCHSEILVYESNSLTLSQADTFGLNVPRILFFPAGMVCTFLCPEMLALSEVLSLAPTVAAISKGFESSVSLEHDEASSLSSILNLNISTHR